MKKKTYTIVICFLFLIGLFLGGMLNDRSTDAAISGDVAEEDTAFYIEDKNNVFVVIAKSSENGIHYVVTLVFDGIKNAFGAIFGI